MRSMMEARAVRRAGAQVALGAAVMVFSGIAGSAFAQSAQQAPTTQQQGQPAPADPAAQQPAPGDPTAQQAPAEPQKPQLTFDNADAVVWFYAVKGDSGPQFEQFFGRVKEAMTKSTNPERRNQAAGMRLMKSTSPAGDGTLNYVLIISPVVKGQEYSPGMLLFEVFPTEAKQLVDQLQSYINSQGLNAAVPLTQVMTFCGM